MYFQKKKRIHKTQRQIYKRVHTVQTIQKTRKSVHIANKKKTKQKDTIKALRQTSKRVIKLYKN